MYRAYGTQSKVQVMCNGLKSIVAKCFEPAALKTNPKGEGTRLGISLSYDNMKLHSSELKVERTKVKERSLLFCCLL